MRVQELWIYAAVWILASGLACDQSGSSSRDLAGAVDLDELLLADPMLVEVLSVTFARDPSNREGDHDHQDDNEE